MKDRLKSPHSALQLHPLGFILWQTDGPPPDGGIQAETEQIKEN